MFNTSDPNSAFRAKIAFNIQLIPVKPTNWNNFMQTLGFKKQEYYKFIYINDIKLINGQGFIDIKPDD